MEQRSPVPEHIYEAAKRYYIRQMDVDDGALLKLWAEKRYPGTCPVATNAAAFWALSVASNYGVARVCRG